MEDIFKAHLLANRLRTEPVATGPATAVRQSEMYTTATGSLVLIGPVRSSFGLFSGPIDRTFKHYSPCIIPDPMGTLYLCVQCRTPMG